MQMTKKKMSVFALMFLIFALSSRGDEKLTQSKESSFLDSRQNSLSENPASMLLTKAERSLAHQWMLSDQDWIKYKAIMSGPRGVWSPGLDPITALGVSETEPVERSRYADIWMTIESRRAELELAFEVERQKAAKRILGDQLVINNKDWIRRWNEERSAVTQQVVLFVSTACKEECREMFDGLVDSIGTHARLDIFFVSGSSSKEIGEWAAFMRIPPETVRSKKITLNYDEGKSLDFGIDVSALPQVRVVDLESGVITKTFQ